MITCARCGKEINSVINCSGAAICHECCRRCFHHNNEISTLYCREAAFFNQLLNAGINITEKGRIYMAKESYTVIIPPFKAAHVAKVKSPDNIKELINSKVSLKARSLIVISAATSSGLLFRKIRIGLSETKKRQVLLMKM